MKRDTALDLSPRQLGGVGVVTIQFGARAPVDGNIPRTLQYGEGVATPRQPTFTAEHPHQQQQQQRIDPQQALRDKQAREMGSDLRWEW